MAGVTGSIAAALDGAPADASAAVSSATTSVGRVKERAGWRYPLGSGLVQAADAVGRAAGIMSIAADAKEPRGRQDLPVAGDPQA